MVLHDYNKSSFSPNVCIEGRTCPKKSKCFFKPFLWVSNLNKKGEFYRRSKPCVVVDEHGFFKGNNEQQHTVYTMLTTVELP